MVTARRLLAALGVASVAAGSLALPAASAAPGPPAGPVLQAAPSGSGTACSTTDPCPFPTALSVAASTGGRVRIELAPGTYQAGIGFHLSLSSAADVVTIVGAPAGSALTGARAATILTLAGTGAVRVEDLTLKDGATAGDGGAIADAGGPALSVDASAFVDDHAGGKGGAIAVSGRTRLSVVASTFVGDTAGSSGGAIDESGGRAVVVGSTIVSSSAPSGGGIAGDGGAVLEADVLALDKGGSCAGPMATAGGLVTDDETCPSGPGSLLVPASSLFPGGKPSLARNGGPTETVQLSTTSDPAFDSVRLGLTLPSGSTRFCSTPDARGVPRHQPVPATGKLGPGCSPGAVQAAPPVVNRVLPGSAGTGARVTLVGFGLSLATGVQVGATSVGFTTKGDRRITFTVPSGLGAGPTTIKVASPDADLAPSGLPPVSFTVAGPLRIETGSLARTETGATYFADLVATGGAGGYRWQSLGSLPKGLHVSRRGLLAGFPSTPGRFPIRLGVTDRAGVSRQVVLELVIGTGPTITTSSVRPARVGVPYAVRLVAKGGKPPYRWSVPSSRHRFPGGFLLSSRGVLSGLPGQVGTTETTFKVTDADGGTASVTLPVKVLPPPPPPQAIVVATPDGHVAAYGSPPLPDRAAHLQGRAVSVATAPDGRGYWLLTSTGAVLGLGSVHTLGSVGTAHLVGTPVGIAADPSGTGYWVVSSTGQVYGFGTAHALGTARSRRLAAKRLGPVVGIAASPRGKGYWLVGSTGQVAAFGTATLLGSIPARLRIHVAAIAATPLGGGYVILSRAGRIFGFGSARRLGYATAPRAGTFVGIATARNGLGAWLVTTTGRVVHLGSARALSPSGPTVAHGAVAIASSR